MIKKSDCLRVKAAYLQPDTKTRLCLYLINVVYVYCTAFNLQPYSIANWGLSGLFPTGNQDFRGAFLGAGNYQLLSLWRKLQWAQQSISSMGCGDWNASQKGLLLRTAHDTAVPEVFCWGHCEPSWRRGGGVSLICVDGGAEVDKTVWGKVATESGQTCRSLLHLRVQLPALTVVWFL